MRKALFSSLLVLLATTGLGACDALTVGGLQSDEGEGPASIGALQGSGARSAYEGQSVTVQGVVTGNFVTGMDGFFMQDAAGTEDGDPATADGVYVQWSRDKSPRVRRGDRVRVSGEVVERGRGGRSLTTVQAEEVEALGRGGVNITSIDAPPASEADWARLEGMWLRISAPLTVTGNGGLLRYGDLEVSFGERLLQPTDVHPPGPAAEALAADNARRLLVLDDNRRGEYPRDLWFVPDEGPSNAAPLRVGSTLGQVEGILGHDHGRWRLHLTDIPRVLKQAPRPAAPQPPPGLRLASINLLNYFNGDGRGRGFPTPRGAASSRELTRQTAKTVAMLATLRPDIVAAAELENDGHDARSAEAALIAALNAELGDEGDYRAVVPPPGGAGEDVIRVGLFYRESRVRPYGPSAALTDGPFRQGSRPPLAQAFVPLDGGVAFTVVANHFKSKGSCPPAEQPADAGNRDNGDGQACWNAARVAAAQALHDWLTGDPAAAGNANAVLLGDFNANSQEDPLRRLRELGWRDAFELGGTARAYSYVHAGQAGRIDHALVSPTLADKVSGAVVWHANADESEAFDFRIDQRKADWYSEQPWRASDHDPLLIGLDFSRAP